jgi:predicted amidohydrolase
MRSVRVASISFMGAGRASTPRETIERNLNALIRLMEKAYADEPDIICLPECSPMLGLSIEEMVKAAEEVPGRIFNEVASKAKDYGVYVICPMIEKKEGYVYNSAILIDRGGEYVGSYHKMYPTIGEMNAGIRPGTEPKTFTVDFGKIGVAICFDLNFEDVIKGMADDGAELIFFPSMYPGGLQLKMWAFKYAIYFVSAITGEGSVIVDPLGRVLATSSVYSPVICKTINLDYKIIHIDYHYEKMDSIKRKYGAKVEIEVSRPEGIFLLTSNLKDLSVNDLINEFQLDTREEYFQKSARIRAEILRKASTT